MAPDPASRPPGPSRRSTCRRRPRPRSAARSLPSSAPVSWFGRLLIRVLIVCVVFDGMSWGADAGSATGKKTVEEIMPIATGHEREELEAELEVCGVLI